MRLLLVASSYVPKRGGLERYVDELARGFSRRGVEVEVLTHDPPPALPRVSDFDGFVVRRFVALARNGRISISPSLWEHLRRAAASFDIVHVHSAHAPLALAVLHSQPRRLVFTPHAPASQFLRWWPYSRITQAVMSHATHTICTTAVERELFCRRFPGAAGRIGFVPHGVDVDAINSARPFTFPGSVVLAVGHLEQRHRIDKTIAAIAALEPAFRLAVVGDGPARQKLAAHATDLCVSSRVRFLGSLPDAELYRWLRTSNVVVALAEQDSSGLQVTEALAADVPVVASDIPVHREAATYAGGAGVRFVAPTASPLEIADAICEASEFRMPQSMRSRLVTWDDVVERTLEVHKAAVRGGSQIGGRPRMAVVAA